MNPENATIDNPSTDDKERESPHPLPVHWLQAFEFAKQVKKEWNLGDPEAVTVLIALLEHP